MKRRTRMAIVACCWVLAGCETCDPTETYVCYNAPDPVVLLLMFLSGLGCECVGGTVVLPAAAVRFSATIEVAADGSYRFFYDGFVTGDAGALRGANPGPAAKRASTSPGVIAFDRLADGRHRVGIDKNGLPGEAYAFPSAELKMLSIEPRSDGTLSIEVRLPDGVAARALGPMLDGTLDIELADGVIARRHDATSTIEGVRNTYSWRIDSTATSASMIVGIPAGSGLGGGALRRDSADPFPLPPETAGAARKATAASWTSNGPYGGPVRMLAIDPRTASTLYLATASGVFKSTNGGALWTRSSSGLTDAAVTAIAIDPATPATLYAAAPNGGVFRSLDGAATWTRVNAGLSTKHVFALTLDPAAPTTVYAATLDNGVFKSTDRGGSWKSSNAGLADADIRSLAFDRASAATLYAGTGNGHVFKSADAGATWKQTALSAGTSSAVTALAFDPQSLSTIYAATATGVFKSVDGGAGWTAINAGLPSAAIQTLAVDATTLYAGTTVGAFKSVDRGATWSAASSGLDNTDVTALAVGSSSTVYAGTDFGVYKSTNAAGAWTRSSSGLANIDIRTVVVDPKTPATLYAGGLSGAMFKSPNSGATWSRIKSPAGLEHIHAMAIDPTTPSTLYAGTGAGVYKSTNGAATWASAGSGLNGARIYSLLVDPQSPSTVYAGTMATGIFKSTDGGKTWTASNGGVLGASRIYGISYGSSSPRTLWVAARTGAISDLWASTDDGKTWVAHPGIDYEGLTQQAVTYFSGAGGIRSLTLGVERFLPHWIDWDDDPISGFRNCLPATTVLADPTNSVRGFVSGACGVLQSTDNGLTFTRINTGLPDPVQVNVLAVSPSGSDLYAGTQGSGIFRLSQFDAPKPAAAVVEYLEPDLDHYFITADPVEQTAVDGGAAGPFSRTGDFFKPGGTTAVCRFYGNANINPATGTAFGPNSHFYTADPAECAQLKALYNPNAKSWKFESNDFSTTPAANGQCPAALKPVYRAYNDGFAKGIDSNHRITANKAAYDEQVAKGWKGEGIVMCAPQ